MADNLPTLADVTKISDANLADRNISDLLNDAPVLRLLAADTRKGNILQYTKETGAPTVGFRTVNHGRDMSKSSDTLVTVTMQILSANSQCDKRLADIYEKGAQAYIEREIRRHLRAAYFAAEMQILNGTGGDASGFAGLADALALGNAMVIDAGGDEAQTASSIYLIRTTADLNNVAVVAGMDGQIALEETITIKATDDTGKQYPAFYTPCEGWLGLQIGGARSVARICNITAQSDHTVDDDLIAKALELFPASAPPTHIVMNNRSLYQLRASRTATNATGAPAPIPTEVYNIPVVTTDALLNTEAIEVAGS